MTAMQELVVPRSMPRILAIGKSGRVKVELLGPAFSSDRATGVNNSQSVCKQ
jgi:hypothetical protein